MSRDLVTLFNDLSTRVFLAEHSHTRIFKITGPDHIRYLHNRLTQNVKALGDGAGARSFLLTPNGRVQGQFTVLKEKDAVLLIADEIQDDAVAEELKRAVLQFKVADQLTLEDLSTELTHFSLYGDRVHDLASGLGLAPAGQSKFAHERKEVAGVGVLAVRSETPVTKTFEIFASRGASFALRTAAAMGGISAAGDDLAELIRIASALPKFGLDLSEKVLAPECDTAELISFDKGCYPGQEVVEMATARGRPNRKFVQLWFEGSAAAGNDLVAAEKTVGSLTSAIAIPAINRTLALGFIKSDAADGAEIRTISGLSAKVVTPAQVRELLR